MAILNSGVTNIKVPVYDALTAYTKFDVIYFTGTPNPAASGPGIATADQSGHYYCTSSHTSDAYSGPDASSPTGSGPKWTQDFFFEPSYGSSFNYSNSSYNISYGDGYYSPTNKGVNSLKVQADLVFNGRDDRETKGLIHMLEDSFNKGNRPTGGYSGIAWTPPAPLHKSHEFYVESFQHTFVYPNVNDTSFTFMNEDQSTTDWQGFYVPFSGTSGFYDSGGIYDEHDIVYMSGALIDQSGWYYYSGTGGLTNHLSSPTGVSTQWARDDFYFEVQQKVNMPQTPRINKKQFQNEYFIRTDDGINKSLLNFSLDFKGVTDKQTKAMLHFMENRRGNQQFRFTPPAPYGTQRIFISPQWKYRTVFKDNSNVSVMFVEHPIDYTNKAKTFLTLATTFYDTSYIRNGDI